MVLTDIVREFYSAINRSDIPAAISLLDPEILRVEFEGSPSGGSYRGHQELSEHISQGRSTWAEGSCSPEKFMEVGSKIVVSVHVRVRLKDHDDWIDGWTGDAYAFRNGKISEFRTFFTLDEALAWAERDENIV